MSAEPQEDKDAIPSCHWTKSGSRTIGEADIAIFAALVGLHEGQSMSIDEAAASLFGRRISPGILTVMLAYGLVVQSRESGQSLDCDIREMRLPAPVYLGDTIHASVAWCKSDHRRDMLVEVRNQNDELVLTYKARTQDSV